MANLSEIYNWFMTGKKPTQAQFWASWGSFWNKGESIPQSAVENLSATLNAKAEKAQFDGHKKDLNAHKSLFDNVYKMMEDIKRPIMFNFKGAISTYSELPEIGNELNDAYGILEDGLVYVFNGDSFPEFGEGMNLNLKPSGVIEEGNEEAVSGNVIYSEFEKVVDYENHVIVKKNDSLTGNEYYNTGQPFSGFGFIIGKYQDFNTLILKLGQYNVTSTPFSEVKVRLKKGSYTGELLASVTKSVTIPNNTIQDVEINFPTIANSDNSDIWIEFVCNGNTGLFKGNLPVRGGRYKTITDTLPTSEFSTQSIELSSFKVPFYVELKKNFIAPEIKQSLLTEIIEENNNRPPKASAVRAAINEVDDKFSTLTDNVYIVESGVVMGDKIKSTSSSTFAGWGQLFGKLTNFNRIGYTLNAYDNANKPTYLELVLRKNSYDGEIIDRVKVLVSPELNTPLDVDFLLSDTFVNDGFTDVFISYFADGYFSLYAKMGLPLPNSARVRYSIAKSQIVTTLPVESDSQLYCKVELVTKELHISSEELKFIESNLSNTFSKPDVLLTSKVWLYPTSQYNVFDKNTIIPSYGDNLINYRADYSGSIGQQFNRGLRLSNVPASIDSNIVLNVLRGRNILTSKTQNILSAPSNNGNGITRKVLVIGDSTIDGGDIHIPLKTIFDADVMNLEFLGTRGATGLKHEGRGGWTVKDYYDIGRKLYRVDVSGLSNVPTTGAIYKQIAGNNFAVVEVNVTGGTGYFKMEMVSGSVDLAASGTLTKVSGSGETTINYSGSTIDSANPFYNALSGKFDLATYLTSTGQSMTSGDWVIFQLGINDIFTYTDIASAKLKVDTMITQLNYILDNITLTNSGIRVGLVITIPPADQDAFGTNYALGQTSEMYRKTGLLEFQKRLIEIYDNEVTRGLKRYLISAHLNLDTEYNFPASVMTVNSKNSKTIEMQNNGVHPDLSGNAQIADMYAGIIKYFG